MESFSSNTSSCDNDIQIPGYDVIRRDRNRQGGGVLIATKSDLDCTETPKLNVHNCEMIWAKLKLKSSKDLHICVFYRPHVSDEASLSHFKTSLDKLPKKTPGHLLIAGDFNLPGIDWEQLTTLPKIPLPYHPPKLS